MKKHGSMTAISSYRAFAMLFTAIFALILIAGGFLLRNDALKRRVTVLQSYELDADRLVIGMDREFLNITTIVERFSNAKWVIKLSTAADTFLPEFDLLTRISLREEMVQNLPGNGIVEFVGIAFPNRELMVSTLGWNDWTDGANMLETKYGVDTTRLRHGVQSYQNMMSFFTLEGASRNESLLTVRSLDVSSPPRASAILLISRIKLIDTARNLLSADAAYFELAALGEENPISSVGVAPDDGGYIIKRASAYVPVEYQLIYPTYSAWPAYLPAALALTFGGMVFSFLVSAAVFYTMKRPIIRLMSSIKSIGYEEERASVRDEVTAIENFMHRLYEDNVSLNERAAAYFGAARINILMQLLRGYFSDVDMEQTLKLYAINFRDAHAYCVTLINTSGNAHGRDVIGGLDRLDVVRDALCASVYPYEALEAPDGEIIVIAALDTAKADREALVERFGAYSDELFARDGTVLDWRVGRTYEGLLGISKSYQELKSNSMKMDERTDEYTYPFDWEQQWMESIKRGNATIACRIFDELRCENDSRNLSPSAFTRLITLMETTLNRIAVEMDMPPAECARLLASESEANSDAVWSILGARVNELLALASARWETTEKESALIRYVEQHACDPDLSLKEIGHRFGLSISAVSKAFRQMSGVNFHERVTQLRMERAKALLVMSDYSVEQVAREVGYENEYSFRRAFQKHVNMRPREYTKRQSAGNSVLRTLPASLPPSEHTRTGYAHQKSTFIARKDEP